MHPTRKCRHACCWRAVASWASLCARRSFSSSSSASLAFWLVRRASLDASWYLVCTFGHTCAARRKLAQLLLLNFEPSAIDCTVLPSYHQQLHTSAAGSIPETGRRAKTFQSKPETKGSGSTTAPATPGCVTTTTREADKLPRLQRHVRRCTAMSPSSARTWLSISGLGIVSACSRCVSRVRPGAQEPVSWDPGSCILCSYCILKYTSRHACHPLSSFVKRSIPGNGLLTGRG